MEVDSARSDVSPLPREELALKGALFGRTWRNVPPASVWNYTRA